MSVRILLFCVAVAIFPCFALAYVSVIAHQQDDASVITVADASMPQEFFGTLIGFPHTYEFTLQKQQDVSISVSIPDSPKQKHDIAMILVKVEPRGVSEVARTLAQDQSFASLYDPELAYGFRSGGNIKKTLERGTYHLEVSSPRDDAMYRLNFGNGLHRSYFDNLRMLSEVNTLLGRSPFAMILSTLVYVPLLVLFLLVFLFFTYKRIYKAKVNG